MAGESFTVEPIAHVVGGRSEPTDDYWGGTESIIRIDESRFTPEATKGLDEFSHLEIVFQHTSEIVLQFRSTKVSQDFLPARGVLQRRQKSIIINYKLQKSTIINYELSFTLALPPKTK